ncbi:MULTISPECIES: mycothiol transferase [unclassified Luteococcus]|uniref:mycothiol transferase n=1 Tax=unclassified Luteococcus TaxID=2639923 RepID=UPI00313B2A5E
MDHRDLLTDAAKRPLDTAAVVLRGLDAEHLNAQPAGSANSIAWLVWHAARQMDVQLADLTGQPTVWERDGWAEKLGINRGADDFGLGDSPDAVAALRVTDPDLLQAHLAACIDAFVGYLQTLSEEDLDQIIDDSWDPPVSRGVRLVSIIDDAAVHLGQAAYARGLLETWSIGV